jgi:hypothetical protein
MSAFLPITVLCLVTLFAVISALIQGLQRHLFLDVSSPEVAVLAK